MRVVGPWRGHLSGRHADALSAAPMLALGSIACGALVVGWAAFRRRDLALPA